jgi:hypothetical protein
MKPPISASWQILFTSGADPRDPMGAAEPLRMPAVPSARTRALTKGMIHIPEDSGYACHGRVIGCFLPS